MRRQVTPGREPDRAEYFGMLVNQAYKVAVITNT
jgi:hypothetical protein